MQADTRTEEQKLIDGLLQAGTEQAMVDILNASPLLATPKTIALAMASFARLLKIEQRLRWFEEGLST